MPFGIEDHRPQGAYPQPYPQQVVPQAPQAADHEETQAPTPPSRNPDCCKRLTACWRAFTQSTPPAEEENTPEPSSQEVLESHVRLYVIDGDLIELRE